MNVSETLRGLLRRWYVVVAGILLAGVAGYGTWTHISPTYVRSASQLLLPGTGSLPPGENNPYLYLGGLVQATEVVARVAGSNDVVAEIVDEHPGTQITVVRDPSTSGPVVLITVTANSDEIAADAVNKVAAQTPIELARLQDTKSIQPKNRISVKTLTVDQKPTLEQRKRLVATGGATAGIVAISLLLASLLDGMLLMRRRRKATRAEEAARSASSVATTEAQSETTAEQTGTAPADPLVDRDRPEPADATDDEDRGTQTAKVLEPASRRP